MYIELLCGNRHFDKQPEGKLLMEDNRRIILSWFVRKYVVMVGGG